MTRYDYLWVRVDELREGDRIHDPYDSERDNQVVDYTIARENKHTAIHYKPKVDHLADELTLKVTRVVES